MNEIRLIGQAITSTNYATNRLFNFNPEPLKETAENFLASGVTDLEIPVGLLDPEGKFYLIARSNIIRTPQDGPSEIVDGSEEWMAIDFDEIYALSGGFGVGLSSGELKERRKKLLEQFLSSPGVPGSITSPAGKGRPKGRHFFLQVATELILYGRTMADAKVTVAGDSVKLRPDGTFSLRYFLPDGTKDLPVKAVSADEIDSQTIGVRVTKETEAD